MARYVELGSMLRQRLDELELRQTQLRELLEARGVEVSANTVSLWITGGARPRIDHMEALLDVLAIHGNARLAAYRAAGRGASRSAA